MSPKTRRARTRRIQVFSSILCTAAFAAYVGVFVEGRAARNAVRDWIPYGARLGSDTTSQTNASPYPQYGIADLGTVPQQPSRATWTIATTATPDVAGGPDLRPTHIFFVADEPLMYGAQAAIRVLVSGRPVGEIRARGARANGPFPPDLERTLLLVPPEKALGYQFALPADATVCRATCHVSVAATNAMWRIYRVGIARETARFASQAP